MEQSSNKLPSGRFYGSVQRDRFETDVARLVRRHLSDKNDVITDDDIRSIRISTELPPFNEVTTAAEAATNILAKEKETPSDRPVTP